MAVTIDFMVPRTESQAFDTAFYRFAEMKLRPSSEEPFALATEALGIVDRKTVTLWSAPSLGEFADFWSAFRKLSATRARYIERRSAAAL